MTTAPEGYTEDVREYLNGLRESNAVNMFGAGSYVEGAFGVDRKTAKECVMYWMETFEEGAA